MIIYFTQRCKNGTLCAMAGLLDPILNWVVVVLPTLLSLVGVLVTLEPWDKRHKFKWRVGLILCGIIVSTLIYWQQARMQAKADTDAREFREHVIQEERNNTEKSNALTERFNSLVAQSLRQSKPTPILIPKMPTAEEIASALGKKLKDAQPTPPSSPAKNDTTATNAVPVPIVPPVIQPPITQPCRGDRLSGCSDEQLLEWGKPLLANMEAIENDYMADLKKLDDIKGGNWFSVLIGIGDKDSKWLKAYTLAQEKAAERFRDCCAENALVYHKELAQRTGGGLEKTELYEWIQSLMKPIKSKEWKNVRQDAGKIVDITSELHILQINLKIASIKRQAPH